MTESNLADDAAPAADATVKTAVDTDDGLPGLQRLWNDSFGALRKLCQKVLCADPASPALAENSTAAESLPTAIA